MQWQMDPWQGLSLSGRARGSSAQPATASGADCFLLSAPVGIAAGSGQGTATLLCSSVSHCIRHRLLVDECPHATCWSYAILGLLCQPITSRLSTVFTRLQRWPHA